MPEMKKKRTAEYRGKKEGMQENQAAVID